MKLKGFYVIPLIAILVAMLSLGAFPGAATDTTAESASEVTVSDTLTYPSTEERTTKGMEEEIEEFISSNFSDDIQSAEGPIRGFSELMANLLNSFKNILNSIVRIFQISGGLIGDGGALDNLGSLLPTGGLLG